MKLSRKTGLIALTITAHAFALDTELHGLVDGRLGARTQNDPHQDERSLSELRVQLDALTYFEQAELQVRADLLYDELASDQEKIDLETGDGFIDLRECNLLFTPVDWADVKVGRQILTWGTGDLIFINDLFPKDWNSFLLGREMEYLKAPSDAVFASFFPSIGTLDVAYMPRFEADRYVDGRRVSYWNPALGLAGQNAVIDAERRDEWFRDDELSLRFYRNISGFETALYGYHGFWKSPLGVSAGSAYFPRMNAGGISTKGMLGNGIIHAEAGYYDTAKSSGAPDDEFRVLTGYEREIARNLTASTQYYLEHSASKDRHVITLRLTQMLMNQNLILGLFSFYSPSDKDAHFRPSATYKISDHWTLTAAGSLFVGEDKDTFFGQFRNNSNVNLGLRYSF